MEPSSSISRRRVLALAGGGTLALGGIGAGSVVLGGNTGKARATAQMDNPGPSEISVATADGTIRQIIADFLIDFIYENAEEVSHFRFHLTMNGQTVSDETYYAEDSVVLMSEYEGQVPDDGYAPTSATIDLEPAPELAGEYKLFDDDSEVEPSQFEVTEDGATETFNLNFEMEVSAISSSVTGHDGPGDDAEVVVSATATEVLELEITNEEDTNGGGDEGNGSDPDPSASISVYRFNPYVKKPNGEWVPEEPTYT